MWTILAGHWTWQTECKTAPLTIVQLCEYEHKTLGSFCYSHPFVCEVWLFNGPSEFFTFGYCAWLWSWLIASNKRAVSTRPVRWSEMVISVQVTQRKRMFSGYVRVQGGDLHFSFIHSLYTSYYTCKRVVLLCIFTSREAFWQRMSKNRQQYYTLIKKLSQN